MSSYTPDALHNISEPQKVNSDLLIVHNVCLYALTYMSKHISYMFTYFAKIQQNKTDEEKKNISILLFAITLAAL